MSLPLSGVLSVQRRASGRAIVPPVSRAHSAGG